MKHLLLIIVLLIFIGNVTGQIKSEGKNFILDFLKSETRGKTFIYTKGIHKYELASIIKYLRSSSDTFKSWRRINNKLQVVDSLILTKKEKEYIINELEKQVDTSLWNNIQISNAKSISRDAIDDIFKDRNKGWQYFYKNYGSSFSSFSLPIFFRKKNLCAFYYDNSCGGLCGGGGFDIFKKVNGKWFKWFNLYTWES